MPKALRKYFTWPFCRATTLRIAWMNSLIFLMLILLTTVLKIIEEPGYNPFLQTISRLGSSNGSPSMIAFSITFSFAPLLFYPAIMFSTRNARAHGWGLRAIASFAFWLLGMLGLYGVVLYPVSEFLQEHYTFAAMTLLGMGVPFILLLPAAILAARVRGALRGAALVVVALLTSIFMIAVGMLFPTAADHLSQQPRPQALLAFPFWEWCTTLLLALLHPALVWLTPGARETRQEACPVPKSG